jgi:hypothetical protein
MKPVLSHVVVVVDVVVVVVVCDRLGLPTTKAAERRKHRARQLKHKPGPATYTQSARILLSLDAVIGQSIAKPKARPVSALSQKHQVTECSSMQLFTV